MIKKIGPNGAYGGGGNGSDRRFTDHLTKAKPRRTFFSKLFCTQRLTKSKQLVLFVICYICHLILCFMLIILKGTQSK